MLNTVAATPDSHLTHFVRGGAPSLQRQETKGHRPSANSVSMSFDQRLDGSRGAGRGGSFRRTSRTVGEAWLCCHRTSSASAVGSLGAASAAAFAA